jgi:hypothetical protein
LFEIKKKNYSYVVYSQNYIKKQFSGCSPLWLHHKIEPKKKKKQTHLLTPEQCFYSILFGEISHTAMPKEKSSAKDFFGEKSK